MKFHVAWDSIEKENRNLKLLLIVILLLCTCLTVTVMSTVAQPPLIVERSCYSRVISPALDRPTDAEMKTFIGEALKARFNTLASDDDLLSVQQTSFRDREQTELQKQKMKQFVVVGDIQFTPDGATVNTDRLISVGDVRSTFKFPLKVKFERVSRSKGDPYGLVLTEVSPIQEEVKK